MKIASAVPTATFGTPGKGKARTREDDETKKRLFKSPVECTAPSNLALRKETPSSISKTTVDNNQEEDSIANLDEETTTCDEIVILETRSKVTKRINNYKWTNGNNGILRLYRNKITGAQRMELKNIENDKVHMNFDICNQMAFIKVVKNSKKKGVAAAYVRFGAIEDESKGLEIFMLQVNPERLDKLYSTLKGMARRRNVLVSLDGEKSGVQTPVE